MKKITENEDGTYAIDGELYGKIAATGKIIQLNYEPKDEKERLFCGLLNGLEMKKDAKYPDSIFYCKGNEVWFEQDEKNNYFWCKYATVWSKFEDQFSMQYNEIQKFVTAWLWSTLKLKGYTPQKNYWAGRMKLWSTLKLKGYTPDYANSTNEKLPFLQLQQLNADF